MSKIQIKKIQLKGKQIESHSGNIYSKLGLKVKYRKFHLTISSTKSSRLLSIHKKISVEIKDIAIVKVLTEEGFCWESTNEHLEMVDELGNKIIVIYTGKKLRRIAILTSGGDAPGMNGAIRAVVRTAKKWGAVVFGVYCGYDGLIKDNIVELEWDSVGHVAYHGGTFLLSARSSGFLTVEGRKMATYNLIKRKIDGLIILGGDGSIKGGLVLHEEFKTHIDNLIAEGKIEKEYRNHELKVIAIPATIDNDIPEADITMGADSCLHRVVECIDSLATTMASHQRTFVVEVMGRNCGWIALMAHFSVGSEYVFLPETPCYNWKKELKSAIETARKRGKMGHFVVISEGAVGQDGIKIHSEDVKKFCEEELHAETRVLKLGHIQRGGKPSAFDRIMATLLGCKAASHMLSDHETIPMMATYKNGEYVMVSLEKANDENNEIGDMQKRCDFQEIRIRRGHFFNRAIQLSEKLRNAFNVCSIKQKKQESTQGFSIEPVDHKAESGNETSHNNVYGDIGTTRSINVTCSNTEDSCEKNSSIPSFCFGKLAVVHLGKRAGGMNVALHVIVRYSFSLGQEVYIIQDGLDGLLSDQIKKVYPYDFIYGMREGGSIIGSSMNENIDPEMVYDKLIEHNIERIIIIGGCESLKIVQSVQEIMKKRDNFINIIIIPASIENNMPGTDICLGADTSLNALTIGCDFLRLSSMSGRKTVFLLEVQGEESGYLCLYGGIAAGAFDNFIPERKYKITHLTETAKRLKNRFKHGNRHGVILVKCSSTFSNVPIDAFCRLLITDADQLFNAKYCVFGDLVQGGNASPIDRITATNFGMVAVDLLINIDDFDLLGGKENFIGVLGTHGKKLIFTDIEECIKMKDDLKSGKTKPIWLQYANICRSME